MKEHIIINKDRTVVVPDSVRKIGIQYDHKVNTLTFDCPRYADDNQSIDMSRMAIYINFSRNDKTKGSIAATNVFVDPDDPEIMHFDFVITRSVTLVNGPIICLVCAKSTDAEGVEVNHWNSELFSKLSVGEGMEAEEELTEEEIDYITSLLQEINTTHAEVADIGTRVEDLEFNQEKQGVVSEVDLEAMTWTDGSYITGSGTIGSSSGYGISELVTLPKMSTLILDATGYQSDIAMIAKTDHTPLVTSVDGKTHYEYYTDEEIQVYISCKTTVAKSAKIVRNVAETLSDLERENSELKSDLADISNILADVEVLTPTIEENKIYSNSYHSGLPFSDHNTYTFSVEKGKTYYINTKVVGVNGYAVFYKFKNGSWVYPVGEYPSYSGIVTDFEFVCGDDCDAIKITVANDTTPNVKTIGVGKKNVYAEIEKVKPTYNNFVKRQGDEIYVKAKYGASHDIVFRINKGGGNNLPDIRYVYLVRNNGVLNNDLTSERYILSNPSDIFSPHIMSATNNADGDHIDEVNYFTGGNHRSNNTGSGGGVTAHSLLFKVYCDDNEVIDSEAFGNKVTVKWINTIAGYNTSKDDGTGREILKEEITLEIVGSLISVTIIHTALESLSRITYFGLQMYCDNMEKIRYIGGANRSEYNPQGASNSGNKNCRNIVLSNPTNKDSIEIGIDNIDLGDFSLDSLQYSAFTTIVKKSYFGILYDSNLQMNENDSTVVKGYYHFKPMLVN